MQWQLEISELERALSREKEALCRYQRLMQRRTGRLPNPRRAQSSTTLPQRESSARDLDGRPINSEPPT